jgi:hypothetical protein
VELIASFWGSKRPTGSIGVEVDPGQSEPSTFPPPLPPPGPSLQDIAARYANAPSEAGGREGSSLSGRLFPTRTFWRMRCRTTVGRAGGFCLLRWLARTCFPTSARHSSPSPAGNRTRRRPSTIKRGPLPRARPCPRPSRRRAPRRRLDRVARLTSLKLCKQRIPFGQRCPNRVKLRRTQCEHMFSGLLPIPDIDVWLMQWRKRLLVHRQHAGARPSAERCKIRTPSREILRLMQTGHALAIS